MNENCATYVQKCTPLCYTTPILKHRQTYAEMPPRTVDTLSLQVLPRVPEISPSLILLSVDLVTILVN